MTNHADVVFTLPMVDLGEYAAWLWGAGLSESTINHRVAFARARAREWGRFESVTPEHIATWLNRYDGWTRCTYDSSLRSMFDWMVHSGRIDRHPMNRMARPPKPDPRPTPLSGEEVDAILGAATGNLRTWILLGLRAGLRSVEMARFKGDQITRSGIYVVGKGGQGAMVPTHEDLWQLAAEYPRTGFWFPSPKIGRAHITEKNIQFRTAALFRDLGITGCIHRTRATFGTELLHAGHSTRVIQKLLRHRRLSSTEHYLGVNEDELTSAIRSLPRRGEVAA